MTTFTAWMLGGNLNYDVGVVNVTSSSNPFPLVSVTGANGLTYDAANSYAYTPNVTVWGYPAAAPYNGEQAYYCYNLPTATLTSLASSKCHAACHRMRNDGWRQRRPMAYRLQHQYRPRLRRRTDQHDSARTSGIHRKPLLRHRHTDDLQPDREPLKEGPGRLVTVGQPTRNEFSA